jgi:aryl-alcohol dehydrogenase-like predicted oxidoreductase
VLDGTADPQLRVAEPRTGTADAREPAEQILGRALTGRRDDVIIASKSCEAVGPGVNQRGLSRRHIIGQVEQSLRRLNIDHIDLYYAHNPDPDTPWKRHSPPTMTSSVRASCATSPCPTIRPGR